MLLILIKYYFVDFILLFCIFKNKKYIIYNFLVDLCSLKYVSSKARVTWKVLTETGLHTECSLRRGLVPAGQFFIIDRPGALRNARRRD